MRSHNSRGSVTLPYVLQCEALHTELGSLETLAEIKKGIPKVVTPQVMKQVKFRAEQAESWKKVSFYKQSSKVKSLSFLILGGSIDRRERGVQNTPARQAVHWYC